MDEITITLRGDYRMTVRYRYTPATKTPDFYDPETFEILELTPWNFEIDDVLYDWKTMEDFYNSVRFEVITSL